MSENEIPSVVETQSFTVKFGADVDSLVISFQFAPGSPNEAKIAFANKAPTPKEMHKALQAFCEKYPEVFQ
jgi:hypothetical protein